MFTFFKNIWNKIKKQEEVADSEILLEDVAEEPEENIWPIHVIGDSHAWKCFSNSEFFIPLTVGPRTAHQLCEHHEEIVSAIQNLKDKKIIFLFGEIDCRVHIVRKHYRTNQSIKNLAKASAARYAGYVKRLRKEGYDIAISCVFPTGSRRSSGAKFNGADYERSQATMCMNDYLKLFCSTEEIPFLNFYPYLTNKNKRRRDLISDDVHLNTKVANIFKEYIADFGWF